jgi:hypothetical protein
MTTPNIDLDTLFNEDEETSYNYLAELFVEYITNNFGTKIEKNTKYHYPFMDAYGNELYSHIMEKKIISIQANKNEINLLAVALEFLLQKEADTFGTFVDSYEVKEKNGKIPKNEIFKLIQESNYIRDEKEYDKPLVPEAESIIKYKDENKKTKSIKIINNDGIVLNKNDIIKLLKLKLNDNPKQRLKQIFSIDSSS